MEQAQQFFGPFWPFVKDPNITDIDLAKDQLWITDINNARRCIPLIQTGLTRELLERFIARVANEVSKPFNKMYPVLEAETESLRITIVHESVARTGYAVCIRKSPPIVRLDIRSMLQQEYCPKELLSLLINCIAVHMNMIVCGEPGAGKTEAAKFLSRFIPARERVITIEDNLEWHYSGINPGKDCVELQINPKGFGYVDAIKTCLRLNPKWIMLSETRSIEAKYLLESWSTGVHGITTLHCDDIRKIPNRFLNMMDAVDASRLENDVYEFTDVVFMIRKKVLGKDGAARRYIDQMGFLYRDHKDSNHPKNCLVPILLQGKLQSKTLPEEIAERFREVGIADPFYHEEVEKMDRRCREERIYG